MIDILASAVLPVIALVVIGLGLDRMGVFDRARASVVMRLVFLVLVVALIFGGLAERPFEPIARLALAAVVTVELATYGTGFVVARYLFGRGIRDSVLIGLATACVFYLLFGLPMVTTILGRGALRCGIYPPNFE